MLVGFGNGFAASACTRAFAHLLVDPMLMGNALVAIILSVWRSGPKRPVELVGMTSGGTTKVIDRLADAGLVSKSEDGRKLDVNRSGMTGGSIL